MFGNAVAGCLLALLLGLSAAKAEECRGNATALGTSRVIAIDPREHPRVGSVQYPETLPLSDHEVVLTFDDGPLPPHTDKVLDALAAECVKATFFAVGNMARESPEVLQRAYREGHTIGTHTENHPHLDQIKFAIAKREIAQGIASVSKALGGSKAVAPFFRFPYLDETSAIENYAFSQGLMVWSVDSFIDDWAMPNPQTAVDALIKHLERKKRGILLLHDIQPNTAQAVPGLLAELKKREYRVVHVVPADASHPKTATQPAQWAASE